MTIICRRVRRKSSVHHAWSCLLKFSPLQSSQAKLGTYLHSELILVRPLGFGSCWVIVALLRASRLLPVIRRVENKTAEAVELNIRLKPWGVNAPSRAQKKKGSGSCGCYDGGRPPPPIAVRFLTKCSSIVYIPYMCRIFCWPWSQLVRNVLEVFVPLWQSFGAGWGDG